MIRGTTANCKIKSITVTDSTATVTCILYSLSPAKEHKAFKFFLRDKDKTLTAISENIYWIDRINNYNNSISNIDVNQYLETTFFIDITNANTADLVENKWVRECNLVLQNIEEPTTSFAWVSEDLTLVSKEFEIPIIKDLDIRSDKNYNLFVDFLYQYKSQADFNYTNNNLYTTINILSIYTNSLLETIDVRTDENSRIHADFLTQFNTPIKIQIQLKNNKGDILYTKERIYIPFVRQTSTFIRTAKGVERVLAYYVKDNVIEDEVVVAQEAKPKLFKARKAAVVIPGETPALKINFNNAVVKLPKLKAPEATALSSTVIKITNPNVDLFDTSRMTIYLDGVLATETFDKVLKIDTTELGYTKDTETVELFMEVEGRINSIYKAQIFMQTFLLTVICSNRTVCSEILLCTSDKEAA
jgi:hypothetical protein